MFKVTRINGLPLQEAERVCKERYQRDFAKLTIHIADPEVLQIKKDLRVRFVDQLGIIGM